MKPKKIKKDAHLWARDPDDWYIEPSWCSDALFAAEQFDGEICDPACGIGRILDFAKARGHLTFGIDIRARGAEKNHIFLRGDFFKNPGNFENIVCNPPYKYDEAFLTRALEHSQFKTAFLLRAQWANAGARSAWLETLPLKRVLMITPRPSMPPGAVVIANKGKDPSGGQTDYAWFIFERDFVGMPSFGWVRRAKKVTLEIT